MNARDITLLVLLCAFFLYLRRRPRWLVACIRKALAYNHSREQFAPDWRIWFVGSLVVFIVLLIWFRFDVKHERVSLGLFLWAWLTSREVAEVFVGVLYCSVAMAISALGGWIAQCFIVMALHRHKP